MRKLLRITLSCYLMLLYLGPAQGQMLVGTDTLYGHEWINYDQRYYRIPVAEDGLYRIDVNALTAAGVSPGSVSSEQLRLFHNGSEVPIHVSTAGLLSNNDFLLFWGEQNRGELDVHLFEEPAEQQLNPFYSLVTDTAAYYLTWGSASSNTRLETIDTDLTNAPTKEDWVWQQAGEVFTEKFMKNYTRRSGITIYYSHYDVAEGYGNRNINELLQSGNTAQDFSLELPNAYIGGPNARFTARFGVGEGSHHQIVQIDGGTYFDRTYSGIAVKAPNFSFPLTDDNIDIHFEGQADDRDEASIAFYQVDYPSQPDADNQRIYTFEVEESASPKYLEISNFNSNGGTPMLYDLTNGLRIRCLYENGIVKAILPASTTLRSLVLLEETSAAIISDLQSVNFTNLLAQETEFLILTSPELRKPYENQDQVQAYADYRASTAGGNYKTQIVEVEDLYHQFGYGLSRHPQSIRNFTHALARRWPNLKYVFIIGKGREYPSLRSASGLADAIAAETFFVPSFGFPASDNLMLSTNTSSVAVVPVGRIAATTPKEISIYLRKVETLEATVNNGQTIEERAWMKNIMHLGGGGNSGEQNAIKSNLERMADEIETNLFGAKVTPFYKTSTDPIQQSRSQQIFDRINEGTAVITFFGHSSPGTFDFNIDNPDNYENFGKFPLIMSLGCYSGNFFTSSKGIGERFTFYEDKASVAFGASRGVGFISTLGAFADRFYEKMGSEKYGQGIGDMVSATRASFDHLNGLEIKTVVEQFSLMGDPAIRLHPSPGPDYVVDRSSVEFSPKVISIQEDSFQLSFDVLNLGQFIQDSMTVDIRQKLPGGEELKVKSLRIATPAYASHHTVNLPTQGKAAIGLNTFFIDLDVQDEVDELPAPAGEMNNSLVRTDGQAGVNLFIVDNTARPVYPPKFALVGSAPVTLKSSTSDALAPERKYLLEIDTTHLFDSPLKERTEIVQRGGVIKWTPSLPLHDSTVYYWRISPDSTEAEIGYVWEASSFTYIEGSPNGWGQGHWGQFLENDFTTLNIDNQSNLSFPNKDLIFRIKNKLRESSDPPIGLIGNHRWVDFFTWGLSESLNIVVFHRSMKHWGASVAHIWYNDRPGDHGSTNTRYPQIACFPFSTATLEDRQNIISFLHDIVPDEAYVVVYTALSSPENTLSIQEWANDSLSLGGLNLFNTLEAQGATQFRGLLNSGAVPYYLAFQKGGGVLEERLASDVYQTIDIETAIPAPTSTGYQKSVLIGPASSWQRLEFDISNEEEVDSSSVSVFGETSSVELEDPLIEGSTLPEIPLSFINPIDYRFLQLKYYAEDNRSHTPPKLENWRVYYEGFPDLTINLSEISSNKDTIPFGNSIEWEGALENLSVYGVDSVLIRFTLEGDGNVYHDTTKWYYDIPEEGAIPISYQFAYRQAQTISKVVKLLIATNPGRELNESNYRNNDLVYEIYFENDLTEPILDVTYDGIHILYGDLISSKPEISITLKDENRNLLLQDTSLFSVRLQNPGGTVLPIDWREAGFEPATSSQNNTAKITWRPILQEDGNYELSITSKDVSGNRGGNLDYKMAFEVNQRRMISNVVNYPNPFSTSTRFLYTITGDIPPEQMIINIMTVSGKMVRQIDQNELGPLRIGTHLTEYSWDGTDDYGAQLANGVYLYQIIATDSEGHTYDNLNQSIDQFFKKGFGKMVLIR